MATRVVEIQFGRPHREARRPEGVDGAAHADSVEAGAAVEVSSVAGGEGGYALSQRIGCGRWQQGRLRDLGTTPPRCTRPADVVDARCARRNRRAFGPAGTPLGA